MKISRLKHKLLISAVAISILLALAYTSAVSLVIRQQHLDQSNALLLKASRVVKDNLEERRNSLLSASRQLATQKNLGSTIWYLTQYARSGLDRETLFNTYQQMVRDTHKIGHLAKVSKVAIYNSAGNLMAFSWFDERDEWAGFVQRYPTPRYKFSRLHADEDFSWKSMKTASIVPGFAFDFGAPQPQQESADYAVVDGLLSIQSFVPIMGETFNPVSGKREIERLGLVVMVQPLDRSFAEGLSRLTDTGINVFAPNAASIGTVPAYASPDWEGGRRGKDVRNPEFTLNEINVGELGYYQSLIPLYFHQQVVGTIAALHSKEAVQHNIWEMIHTLWLIAFVSLLIILPVAWYFAASISHPLTALSRIFRGVAGSEQCGKHSEELQLLDREKRRNDELGDLTQSFIAMNQAVDQKIHQINEINASLERTIEERTAELAAKEREARTLIENSPDTIARYDLECRRILVNPAFVGMTSGGMAFLLGKKPTEFPGGANSEIYEARIREVLATGKNGQFELIWTDKEGNELCSHIRLTAEFDAAGKVKSVLAVGRDISERKKTEELVWRQANFDSLTKLPNRQMFHERLAQEARKSRRAGLPMALMLIDLDRFKEVNDTLGHDKGDLLLVDAARRIHSFVRETDTVARLGGDEFTVILPELEDIASIERIAQAIIDKLSVPFRLGEEEAYISASIGISLYPKDTEALDVLFKNADQAMYVSKNAGRRRFSYFTHDLQEAAQKRMRLTNDLRNALATDQFRVYYQPIVEISTGHIYRAEAMIRWQHPVHGVVSPDAFIPLAEEVGLIIPIGDWVFKQAIDQVRQWRGKYNPAFQISVNKSPVQLRQHDSTLFSWPDYLKQQGLPGSSISVEITEGVLLHPEPSVNEKLLEFRDAGIQVAIDDFGTGYSSLSYLKQFDIDYLKIDRSFVKNLGDDASDLALCEAIIVMAHKLGFKVIAEGVETALQRDLLASAGCDFSQGYLHSHPLPPAEFEKLLTAV